MLVARHAPKIHGMPWTRPDLHLQPKPTPLWTMRKMGRRSILVYCGNAPNCRHQAELNADRWNDEVTLGELQPRILCTVRDHKGADVRPMWGTRRAATCGVKRRLH